MQILPTIPYTTTKQVQVVQSIHGDCLVLSPAVNFVDEYGHCTHLLQRLWQPQLWQILQEVARFLHDFQG